MRSAPPQASPVKTRSKTPPPIEQVVEESSQEEEKKEEPVEAAEIVDKVVSQSESHSGSHQEGSLMSQESVGELEGENYFVKQGLTDKFTPKRLIDATLTTPIRTLISSQNPNIKIKKAKSNRYGNTQVWFCLGVLFFSSVVSIMRKVTAVPESNFWNKQIDCTPGDIYCSYNDVYCTSRNEYHHCTDEEQVLMFNEYMIESTQKEIAKIDHCNTPGKGVRFTIDQAHMETIFGENATEATYSEFL